MDDIRHAYLTDELARLQAENSGMFAFANSRVPSYGTAVPERDPSMADIDDELVDFTLAELSAERGIGIAELSGCVLELTGGERDSVSRGQAVIELANMAPDELLGLAAKKGKKKKPPDDEDDDGADDEDLSDEDIEDLSEHMAENQGNQGPKPRKSRKRRKPVPVKRGQSPFGGEGGEGPSGGAGPSGTGEGGSMAASAPRRALVRAGDGSFMTVALSEDEQWADSEVARLQEEHADARVGLAARTFDVPGDLGGVQRHFPFEVHDVGTVQDDQTKPSDELLSEVQRYLWIHKSMSKPKAYGSVRKGKLPGLTRDRPERQAAEHRVVR